MFCCGKPSPLAHWTPFQIHLNSSSSSSSDSGRRQLQIFFRICAYYIWKITKMRTFCTARSKDRFHGRSGLAALKTWFIRHTHMTQFFYVLWCFYIECIRSRPQSYQLVDPCRQKFGSSFHISHGSLCGYHCVFAALVRGAVSPVVPCCQFQAPRFAVNLTYFDYLPAKGLETLI